MFKTMMRSADNFFFSGVVNWKAFSENFRNLYRVPYSLSRCLHCETTYKDCGESYRGRGQRGVMQGFFGSDDFQGYCGSDCFYEAGGSMFHAMCSSCLNLPHLLLILFYWILSFLLLH